jgi:hypothetical protein
MEEWVEVLFTYDDVEAEIVKDLLEAENIQVVVKSLKISPYPVSIGKMGEIRLLVKSKDIRRSEEVLKAMKQLPGTEKDDC